MPTRRFNFSFRRPSFGRRGGGFGGYGGMRHSIRRRFFGGSSSRYNRRYCRRYLIPDTAITDTTNCLDVDDNKPVTQKAENLLKTSHVEFHAKENRTAHHTDEYELENLIVRRGQSFSLTVTFNKEINDGKDTVILQFVTGNRPKPSKGTLIRVPIVKDLKASEWGAKEVKRDGSTVKYEIMASSTAPVAPWQLFVITQLEGKTDKTNMFRHKVQEEVYILFNPWCKDDNVFMPDEKEREEYILNQTGRIWTGSAKRFQPRAWNFGQFEDVCLLAAMRLLEIAELDGLSRGNPTTVARSLSAMANSADNDGGVLTGNWSGNYSGGTSPVKWNGSVAILEEYMRTKKEVKFGQCWVFSGLLTTLGRTLGIPTRSVTNFASAHDTDGSCTIDMHWDTTTNKPLKFLDDSIWNFHVWNESFFRRPDLPEGHDGWQAYDATPQEASEGVMRCGPASLKAIKNGELYLGYDARFIFAEVNGEINHWAKQENHEFTVVDYDPAGVGKFISTKNVGNNGRQDVTDLYKFKEGTKEERETMDKAKKLGSRKDMLALPRREKEIFVDFDDEVASTGDITAVVKIKNDGKEKRTFNIKICAMASYYNGLPGEEIKEDEKTIEVEGGQSSAHEMPLPAQEYLNLLDADALVKIYCKTTVKETGETFAKNVTCTIDKPDLELEVSTVNPKIGHAFDVKVKFLNPLSIQLTSGEICLEGPGIQKSLTIPVRKPIAPGAEMKEVVSLKPRFAGKREIIASLNTRQLVGINGTIMVDIQKAN